MEAVEYVSMAEVQDRHWWFEAKRRTVTALLARHGLRAGSTDHRVLEVGVGTGGMVSVMTRYGRMVGVDAYLPALDLLRAHRPAGAEVLPVSADLLRLPFGAGNFGLIGCFDVLYHQGVGDVTEALRELHRVCAPGGYLAITDSAFSMLRSSHDVATHAARRFRLGELTEPLEAVGFEIAHATYFHTLLFPPAAAVRLLKRILEGSPDLESGIDENVAPHSDLAPVPGWLNALLLALYRLEIPLTVRFRMPIGVSLLILARRPE